MFYAFKIILYFVTGISQVMEAGRFVHNMDSLFLKQNSYFKMFYLIWYSKSVLLLYRDPQKLRFSHI
jgi:hypothetical protein